MGTPQVYQNVSKCCYVGRPPHFSDDPSNPKFVPVESCPPNVSQGLIVGPGDKVERDDGYISLMNNSQGSHTVLCYGTQAEVDADLKALRVPPQAKRGVENLGFTHGDKVGVVFHGTQYVLKEITEDYKTAIEKTHNRLASVKELAALQEANVTKDEIIAKLKEQLAAAHRSDVKQQERAATVAKATRV